MNTYARLLSREEAKAIYKTEVPKHFPRDEIKPWKSISRMWKLNSYFAVGFYEDTGASPEDPPLLGYAFLVSPPDCGACLLDYYAVLPAYRDNGLGSRFLQRLKEVAYDREQYILLETEDIDFSKNEKQRDERARRDAFYARNGCVKTDVKGKVFTVRYAVWRLGGDAPFEQCCEDLRTLYRLMLPGEKNLFVRIQRHIDPWTS